MKSRKRPGNIIKLVTAVNFDKRLSQRGLEKFSQKIYGIGSADNR